MTVGSDINGLVVYGSGTPGAVVFSWSKGTSIYVDSATGDIWGLINNVVTRLSKGLSAYRQIKMKAADESRTTNTVLSDDNTLLFAIGANDVWGGRCFLDVSAGLSTTGLKITIAAPSGASGNIHAGLTTNATSGKEVDVQATNTLGTALDFTAASLAPSATLGHLELIFRVANGANAGNISVQWAQSTSSGTALTMGAGSQMTADRIS